MKIELDKSLLKEVQLNILIDVDKFCRNNNIRYFLFYGTLLGSIRHKGYIPWDDDIDIAMPRKDFYRFLESYNRRDDNSSYRVLASELDSQFPFPYAKIQDGSTILVEYANINYNFGINIDLFPLDGLPNTIHDSNVIYNRIGRYTMMMNIRNIKLSRDRPLVKNLIIGIGKCFFYFCSYNKIIKKYVEIAQRYDYDTSDYVSNLSCPYDKRERTRKKIFQDAVDVDFEGYKFLAPSGYDEWLRNVYGDYMIYPPEHLRKTHHQFKVYKI